MADFAYQDPFPLQTDDTNYRHLSSDFVSVGEFDGNEVAADGSDGFLYMYGPDADALFVAVRSTLEAAVFMKGARVKLRYGPPENGVREAEIELGT